MRIKTIACFSLFYVLLGIGCSQKKQSEAPVGDPWSLLEYRCAKEIYGACHTSDNSFFTSGGTSICSLVENQVKEIYYENGIVFREMLGDADDNVWVVGTKNGGRIMKCTKDACQFVSETPDMDFDSIHGTISGLKYISGIHTIDGAPWGLIATTQDGESVEIVYEKEGYWIRDVWCDPKNERVVGVGSSLGGATGKGIVVVRGPDNVWKEQTVDTDNFKYSSVWGTGPNEIFIVGKLIHYSEWSEETTTVSIVYRWDGNKFNEVLKSNNEKFITIWGKSSNEIYLGGEKWTERQGTGRPFDAETHVVRWDQTVTSQALLPANPDDNSSVTVFDCSIDGKTVYACATEGYIYQRRITE